MNLDDQLRSALRREPAPADFASRVLARTRVLPFWRRPAALAIAAALALAAIVPSVYEYRRQQRAMEARDQLMVALSITKAQIQQTKEKIRQNTRRKL